MWFGSVRETANGKLCEQVLSLSADGHVTVEARV